MISVFVFGVLIKKPFWKASIFWRSYIQEFEVVHMEKRGKSFILLENGKEISVLKKEGKKYLFSCLS